MRCWAQLSRSGTADDQSRERLTGTVDCCKVLRKRGTYGCLHTYRQHRQVVIRPLISSPRAIR
jgi:hypothetical protein